MENIGATFDSRFLFLLSLHNKTVLSELTVWKDEDGPISVNREGKPTLLEREKIADDMYTHLKASPELTGGVGTNTYWIDIERLINIAGISHEGFSHPNEMQSGDISSLWIHAKPIYLSHIYKGIPIIFTDARLSVLAQFGDTLFVQVPKSRYIKE